MPQYIRPHIASLRGAARCAVLSLAAAACARGGGRTPRGAPGANDAGGAAAGVASPAAPEAAGRSSGRAAGAAALVPAGTTLVLATNVRVCASTYHVGDGFPATVVDTVFGRDGGMIPGGAPATFRIMRVTRGPDVPRGAAIAIALDSIDVGGVRYPASARVRSVTVRSAHRAVPARPAAGIVVGTETGDIAAGGLPQLPAAGATGEPLPGRVTAAPASRSDACIPRHGRITVTLTADERLEP